MATIAKTSSYSFLVAINYCIFDFLVNFMRCYKLEASLCGVHFMDRLKSLENKRKSSKQKNLKREDVGAIEKLYDDMMRFQS